LRVARRAAHTWLPAAWRRADGALRAYQHAAEALGIDGRRVTLASYRAVALYRVARGDAGAGGLGAWRASLARAVERRTRRGWRWDIADARRRARARAYETQLTRLYPGHVRRTRPLRASQLRRVWRRVVEAPWLAGHPWYRQAWAWITVAFGGLLRAGDVLSRRARGSEGRPLLNRQLRETRVRFSGRTRTCLRLDLPFRKARRVRDRDADLFVIPEASGALGARRAMAYHLSLHRRRVGGDSGPVFARYSRVTGARLGGAFTYATGLTSLRWLLSQAGTSQPSRYGTHSLRSGGATELLARGVSWSTVRRLGGWRSEASMIRYDRRRAALAAEVMIADRGHRRRGGPAGRTPPK